ncbi:plasmid stabilization protein ParE [Caulobacter mirabilis]|uniref:Plasmid stabilization protein ParE n=2 Tax=Caulobacter mirabilis TaxID=69666 RepID=A0A2D2B367_9CAUL|nr:type II toxin-antitoxin system RelE/ParE family toxin [Caulobacter mirabilis]ATQ44705.1 plasmid stabilization protein ParE [Caulobacter mirabilis]
MGFRLSRKADEDIIRLYVEGAGQFGEAQAERYYADLRRTLSVLAAYPFAAREHTELRPPVRIHPFRSHIIVYVVDGEDILILRVRHALEDWQRDPR